MNIPNDPKKEKKLPEQAKGNPVYEQTRQDMPLWCCGRNCGRNSRIVVFCLSIIGIACSIWLCLSPDYFKFYALRNDTFFDIDKKQPEPFQYATEATVGLFKYCIYEVFEYPWPPRRERNLFDNMLEEEVKRLQGSETPEKKATKDVRKLQTSTTTSPSDNPTAMGSEQPSLAPSTSVPSIAPSVLPSLAPSSSSKPSICVPPLTPGAGVDCEWGSFSPTTSPTAAPTITNPNDIVAEMTDIGAVKDYPKGMDQFDSVFYNAQLGSILGPIFCAIAFITGLVEYFCCIFKCSWLPTAIFLYLAFMFQMFTLFLFLSDDFCNYSQDCRLGASGYGTVIAVLCYFISQMLVCCTPRPPPVYNLLKPPPKRVKKRKPGEEGYDDGLYYDDDEYYDEFGHDDYNDPSYGHYDDPYDDGTGTYNDGYTQDGYDDGTYMDDGTYNTGGRQQQSRGMPPVNEGEGYDDYGDGYTQDGDQTYDDGYTQDGDQTYDQGTYGDEGYDQGYDDQGYDDQGTYDDQGYDDGTYDQGTYDDQGYDDGTYDQGTYDDESQWTEDPNKGTYS